MENRFKDILRRDAKHNKKVLRELIFISFSCGINVTAPSPGKDSLKFINIFLLLSSFFGMYGQYCYVMQHIHEPITEYIECFYASLQVVISVIKMTYCLFVQRRLYKLLHAAETGEIIGQCEIFDMAFPSTFPILESNGFAFPYYELQYITPCLESFIGGMGAISFDGIFIVVTAHGTALLRILHVIIRYSTHQSIKPQLKVIYLRHCIQHYQRTFKYYDDINNLYGVVSLGQFGLILFVLGMVLFQANAALENHIEIFIKMVFYMIASSFQVFLYCFNGQRLTTESEKLNFSWYDCDWYQESKEFKELIKMMILRSNHIMVLTVSGFTTMSLMTFLSIINTSGSYFLMLKNTLDYNQK